MNPKTFLKRTSTSFHNGVLMKTKKVMILISLVEESREKTNEEIEGEILQELSADLIPWCKEIESVKVVEE